MLDLKKFRGMPRKVVLEMLQECICPTITKIRGINFYPEHIYIATGGPKVYAVVIYENCSISIIPHFGCQGYLNLVKLYQFFKSKRILNED